MRFALVLVGALMSFAAQAQERSEPSKWGYTCSDVQKAKKTFTAEAIAAIKAAMTPEQVAAADRCLVRRRHNRTASE